MANTPPNVILSQPPALSYDELDTEPDIVITIANDGSPVDYEYASNSFYVWESQHIGGGPLYKTCDAINTRLNSLAFINQIWQAVLNPFKPIAGEFVFTDNNGTSTAGGGGTAA